VYCLMAALLIASGSYAQSGSAINGDASGNDAQVASGAISAKVERKANRALSRKVLKALVKIKELEATRIFVKASAGDITLSGTVLDESQVALAVKVAQSVEGVQSVREALRLSPQPDRQPDVAGISARDGRHFRVCECL
jgi:hyperosmotically inducible periplasmic protein